jgi:hypothetical protein
LLQPPGKAIGVIKHCFPLLRLLFRS